MSSKVAAVAEREHALLSASAAHRWLNCTPAARLEETFPETESEYANEGRLAHEIAELKFRKAFTEPMGLRAFNNRLRKLQENPLYQPEMLKYTDAYLDYVSGIVHGFASYPYIAVEKRIDYSTYAPEGFGTGDCIIIYGDTIYVIDFKYGKGVPVSAVGNPQMRLYALGAYTTYAFLYPITTVKTAIVQPRLDTISEEVITVEELLAWGESIKPIAQTAFEGKGEYVSGDHCRFCRAKGQCRARAEFSLSLEEVHFMKPPLISNEEVGQILERAKNLAKWAADLEAYALAECLKGIEIPGWKAVEGRSTRQFTNQDEAFKVLTGAGYEEAMLYERKPLTLAATEKLIGKPKFAELLQGFINMPPGKPTLAPVTDKREAIKTITAEEAFGETANNCETNNENGGNANE